MPKRAAKMALSVRDLPPRDCGSVGRRVLCTVHPGDPRNVSGIVSLIPGILMYRGVLSTGGTIG